MNYFQSFGLRKRILTAVGLACLICAVISMAVARHFSAMELEQGIIDKAETIHSRLDAATDYVALQGGLKPVIERMTARHKSPDELSESEKTEVLKQVPIFAAMKIGAKGAEKEHYSFRVFSDRPRRKENLATAEELAIFKRFEANPALESIVANDGKIIFVYRPVRLRESQGCLNCHGEPSTSPWHNGKDVLGFQMENWSDGKLHGVFAVSSDIAHIKAVQAGSRFLSPDVQIGIMVGLGALAGLILASFLIRSSLERVNSVMESIMRGAGEVGGAVGKILAISQDLAGTSMQQAQSIQETAASIEEISSMANRSAENAEQSRDASESSKKKAERGREVVTQMVGSISEISRNNEDIMREVDSSNRKISQVVQVIQEIDAKTKVINDIVFQTKLLSFNASVEAARAGEHGKGFSVVAEEVGKLAQVSGSAAQEISSLLEVSMKKVDSIVQETSQAVGALMTSAKATVDRGSAVAHECGEVLSALLDSSTEVSEMVSSIASASHEQAKGVTEVSKAIQQIDQATQVSSAAAEKCSSTSNDLAKQVKELRDSAASLRQVVEGKLTMDRFVWGEEYRLNIPHMDSEHQLLIDKINLVAQRLEKGVTGTGLPLFKTAFQDLAAYTVTHFADEEEFMRSIGFPELASHKKVHEALLAKVGEFSAVDPRSIDGRALMHFLNDWLLKHILGADMKYARYHRKKRGENQA
ncbi:MAG: bacteriohemerythrin [Oligoflexia bacterium]|nr:bacteriohemerythrin [Oligoflexia bacterium]